MSKKLTPTVFLKFTKLDLRNTYKCKVATACVRMCLMPLITLIKLFNLTNYRVLIKVNKYM